MHSHSVTQYRSHREALGVVYVVGGCAHACATVACAVACSLAARPLREVRDELERTSVDGTRGLDNERSDACAERERLGIFANLFLDPPPTCGVVKGAVTAAPSLSDAENGAAKRLGGVAVRIETVCSARMYLLVIRTLHYII